MADSVQPSPSQEIVDRYLSGDIDFATYYEYLNAQKEREEAANDVWSSVDPDEITIEEEIAQRMAQLHDENGSDSGGEGEDGAALASETQRLLADFYGDEAEGKAAIHLLNVSRDSEEAGPSGRRSEDEDWAPAPKRGRNPNTQPVFGPKRRATGGRRGGASAVKRSYQMVRQYTSLEEALADDGEFETAIMHGSQRSRLQQLPEALESLLGQANVTAAMGRPEEAVAMIESIIREHANAYAPYQTLATIYDAMGDEEKQLQFGLMGAYLDYRTEGDTWADLGRLSKKLGKIDQAIICFGKAVRASPLDWASWEVRLGLLVEAEERTLESRCRLDYVRALRHAPAVPFPAFRAAATAAAQRFRSTGDLKQAALTQVLYLERAAEEDCADRDEVEAAVQLLLEGAGGKEPLHKDIVKLLLTVDVVALEAADGRRLPFYLLDVVDRFLAPKEIELAAKARRESDWPSVSPVKATLSATSTTGLLAQLLCSLLHLPLKDPSILEVLLAEFERLTRLDCPQTLAVARALKDSGRLDRCRSVLEVGLSSAGLADSAVGWELLGDVLRDLGQVGPATKAYAACLTKEPGKVSARVSLAQLHSSAGEEDAALETILNAEEELGQLKDSSLLKAELELFHSKKMWREYLRSGWTLLAYHYVPILFVQSGKDPSMKISGSDKAGVSFGLRSEFLRLFKDSWMDRLVRRAAKLMKEAGQDVTLSPATLDPAKLYELAFRICDTLYRERRYFDLLMTAGFSYMMPDLVRARLNQRFLSVSLLAAVRAGQPKTAFYILREAYGHLDSLRYWNAHALVFSRTQDVMFHRYILRRAEKEPNNAILSVLAGNNSLIAGTYSAALAEYLSVLRRVPNSPLVSLLTGLTLLHIACKKDVAQRHLVCLQSFAFLLRYRDLRCCAMEATYNLGRAMHQANMLFAAVHFYRLVLEMESPVEAARGSADDDEPGMDRVLFDLRPQAAWNLALIYRTSGNELLAFHLLEEYCTLT